MLRLQAYNYNIKYALERQNAADGLSRSPLLTTDKPAHGCIKMIVNHAVTISLMNIQQATQTDPVLTDIIASITSKIWSKSKRKAYFTIKKELSVENN